MRGKRVAMLFAIALIAVITTAILVIPSSEPSGSRTADMKKVHADIIVNDNNAYLRALLTSDIDIRGAVVYVGDSPVDANIERVGDYTYVVAVPVPRDTNAKEFPIKIETPKDTLKYVFGIDYSPSDVEKVYYVQYTTDKSDFSKFAGANAPHSLEIEVDKEYRGIDVKVLDNGRMERVAFNYQYLKIDEKYHLYIMVTDPIPEDGQLVVWLGDFPTTGQEISLDTVDAGILSDVMAGTRAYVDIVVPKDHYLQVYNGRFYSGTRGGDYISFAATYGGGVQRIPITLNNGTGTFTIRAYTHENGIIMILEADTNKIYIVRVRSYSAEQIGSVSVDELMDKTFNPYIGTTYIVAVPYGEEVQEGETTDGKWDGIVSMLLAQSGGIRVVPAVTYDSFLDSLQKSEKVRLVVSVYDRGGNRVYFYYSRMVVKPVTENLLYLFHTSVGGTSTIIENVDAEQVS